MYEEILSGVFKNIDSLKQEIESYIDRSYEELSPIELSIIYFSLYELKYSMSVPYKVVINEGVEKEKTYGGADGKKKKNGIRNQEAKANRENEEKRKKTFILIKNP